MKFYGELLIFVLLFITNFRVFFAKKPRRDPLTVVAPFTFLLSILQIIAWGVELLTVLGFVIAFLVLISNFHALFRYSEQLYIDRYSPLMKFWAVLTTFLSTVAIAATFLTAPVEFSPGELNVQKNLTNYNGSFRAGFQKANLFSYTNVNLYTFSPEENNKNILKTDSQDEEKPVILFFPDKRADTQNYIPYLQILAQKGFTVMSADFFCDDVKWMHSFEDFKLLRQTALVIQSLQDNQKFMAQREFYSYNILQECQAMLQFVDQNFSPQTKVFLVSDVMGNSAISDFAKMNSSRVNSVFFLDSVEEYKTAGYGCVEQTSPLTAYLLGQKREKTFYTPKILAERTYQHFCKNSL